MSNVHQTRGPDIYTNTEYQGPCVGVHGDLTHTGTPGDTETLDDPQNTYTDNRHKETETLTR